MDRTVIYGVLNWGLGHATRSSVIIRKLEQQGFRPIVASDGAAGEWLQEEFPHLEYRMLQAYNIHYSRRNLQWPRLLWQIPKMAKAAHKEHEILQIWADELKPVGIISDNRLGFHHPEVPSVYISHQLRPRMAMFSGAAAWAHRQYFKKFHEIWVPDDQDIKASGQLSKNGKARKIGLLSSLKPEESTASKIVILLSGPEPQRSILERKIFEQAEDLPEDTILIRGTNEPCPERYRRRIKIYDRLNSLDVSRILAEAELLISRSGYSSIMDYYKLGKKAILIPTPGQSEQEYLARLHAASPYFLTVNQKNLKLAEQLVQASKLKSPQPYQKDLAADLFKLFSK